MLISRVPDEGGEGRGEPDEGGEGRGEPDAAQQIADGCRTASELFDLMTKNHDFESGDDPLTTRDLVLLYKNIDLGKQLMSNANELKQKAPNQYVEDVIYRDGAETDSDLSETYSSEDLHNIMVVNKERINLLAKPSLNSLCHKLGDLEIQVSNVSTDYERNFLFKDPYINEQLQNLQVMSKANDLNTPVLPTSLLDYVCCKRLEDNYNFYMDNIIRYVKHTIEQLKHISNGDFLPDRVKEKWKEVEHEKTTDASKILTTSVSIPLQVERKVTGLTTAWDDIVHSEVDLRSLVRILEKKIVLEIPKMISGSYDFFSKYRADSLIISCKSSKKATKKAKSRVDVVFQLQRSDAGHVVSNIDSIMVLQPKQQIQKDCTELLPLTYKIEEQPLKLTPKLIELPIMDQNCTNTSSNFESDECHSLGPLTDCREKDGNESQECNTGNNANWPGSPAAAARSPVRSPARSPARSVSRVVRAQATSDLICPNDLQFSIQNLDRSTSLPEEGNSNSFYTKERKKSPVKVRIKSPYENKSAILEERKRRRLLQVRERRERKKMAMNDNSKITKHKPSPQAVNSVTKLSITNKAFYNSIYGRNMNCESESRVFTAAYKKNCRPKGVQRKDGTIQEILQESEGEFVEKDDTLSDTTSKINEIHFLDDAETEMSYLQKRLDNEFLRISTSSTSESTSNLCTQLDHYSSLTSLRVKDEKSTTVLETRRSDHNVQNSKTSCMLNTVPSNSPKGDNNKVTTAVECRRSIEKIYALMKKLHQIESSESGSKNKTTASNETRGSTLSESGTSLDHRLSFTNPSVVTFDKPTILDGRQKTNKVGHESDRPSSVVPKVIISTKHQAEMNDNATKKERKKPPRVRSIPENPLKAISQLLHDFDNVQRTRQKTADPKLINRSIATELKSVSRPEPQKRRSRIQSPVKEDPPNKVGAKVKTRFSAREDLRPEAKTHIQERRKMSDLIDEVKEARGEAVRGPPKFSSRLDMLAQPKRAYVQALNEEFPNRQVPDRIRLARSRRRGGEDHSSSVSVKHPHSPERAADSRRSPDGSAESHRAEQYAALAAAVANTLRPMTKKKSMAQAPGSEGSGRGAERVEPARAPLLPDDLLLTSGSSSPEKADCPRSARIGSELRRMVSALRAPRPPQEYAADSDFAEEACTSPFSKTPSIVEDNYVLRDRISTVIEEISAQNVTPISSTVELEMLEHALHRRLSSGTFPGRLRLKKLTLAPKPSLQCVVMQQSGDTSLLLKTSLSQKAGVTKATDQKTDLMGLLSTTRLNCELYRFPWQVSTVGYVFPIFQTDMKDITPKLGYTDVGTSYVVCETLLSSRVLEITDGGDENTCPCNANDADPYKLECAVQTTCSDRLLATECVLNTLINTATTQDSAPGQNVETQTRDGLMAVLSSDTAVMRTEENESCMAAEEHELSEYTTSLDMLVGLLNEIQKITTCQNEVTGTRTLESEPDELIPQKRPADVSTTEIDVKDELDTDSGFSFILPDTNVNNDDQIEIAIPKTKSVSTEAMESKPVCKDQEVLAQVPERQTRHTEVNTDDPSGSRLEQPINIKTTTTTDTMTTTITAHDTDACRINLATKISSTFSVTYSEDGVNYGSNTTIQTGDKVIEKSETNRKSVKSLVPFYNNMFKVESVKKDGASSEKLVQNQGNSTAPCSTVIANNVLDRKNKVFSESDDVQNRKNTIDVDKCSNGAGLDFTLKMKRDILVTFYSILVLTVFAALAFPEILQQA